MSNALSALIGDDRATLSIIPAGRLVVTAAIVVTVLMIVINEALSAPSLAAGEVEQVCGLCHVDWRRQVTGLAIITGLVLAANWLLGGPKWPPDGESGGDE